MSYSYNENEARRDPAVRLRPAFQLAIEDVRPQLTARFASWRDIPRLQAHSEAFLARMEAVTSGKKARVDFKRAFARFIKNRLPDYPVATGTGELFRCMRPLDSRLALGIDWTHKAAWGLGKMLEVKVGARWANNAAAIYHPLAYFFGSGESADWAYITKEDLDACFEGAAQFLDVLLPLLAEALPKRMREDVDLDGAGPISARQGYQIARRLVDADPARLKSDLQLQSIMVLPGTGRWGTLLSPDGRLRAHAIWAFYFKGASGEGARIEVPSLGGPIVNFQAHWVVPGDPVGDAWLDSTDALAAIEATGSVPKGAVPMALTLGYSRPYVEGPSWRIDLVVPGSFARTVALIDARDGQVVWL